MSGFADIIRKTLGWYSSASEEAEIPVIVYGGKAPKRLSLVLYESPTGAALANFSHNAPDIAASTGEHGFEALPFTVPLTLDESFYYRNLLINAWAVLSDGAADIWRGYVDQVGVVADGISVTALGVWRNLSRLKYSALWSDADVSHWEIFNDRPLTKNDRFEMDTNGRLHIAPKKGEEHGADIRAFVLYRIPHNSSRQIIGIEFTYDFDMPAGWEFYLRDSTADGITSTTDLFVVTASESGTCNITFSALDALVFRVRFNDTAAEYTGETGSAYLNITDLRVVTTTANRVNTTTATTIGGGSVVVTPASMANIYEGQRLFIDQQETVSESVLVTAVTDTTFTASFAFTYSGTTTIHAHVVYSEEIVQSLVGIVSALTGSYLSSSTLLIEQTGIDLTDEIYEDANPADIITYLANLGDASGNIWETGVLDNEMLYFRERASVGRAWYVDPISIEANLDLAALANSMYAQYRDESGATLRTTPIEDSNSIEIYGIEVQGVVSSNSSLAGVANLIATTALNDGATPAPQVGILIDRLFDVSGNRVYNWEARSGDTSTSRSLSPRVASNIDRVGMFRLAGHSYTPAADALELVPERPLPTLDRLVARRNEGL